MSRWTMMALRGAWLVIAVIGPSVTRGDEELGQYYEQLRRRGLYTLAAETAQRRLREPQLGAERQLELVLELSRTWSEQALHVQGPQQRELWGRAASILDEERGRQPDQAWVLESQGALVVATQAASGRWDVEAAPHDRPLRRRYLQVTTAARERLPTQIDALSLVLKRGRQDERGPALHQVRMLLGRLLVTYGEVLRDRVAVGEQPPPDRAADLLAAATAFQQGLGHTVDPKGTWRGRLGLAEVARLRHDFPAAREHCAAMLGEPQLEEAALQAVEACRIRCLLDEGEPLRAAEALLALRQARPLLIGEVWWLQLQTLIRLREDPALQADAALQANLATEAELVLTRVAEQAGAVWLRRCRQLLDRAEARRRMGPELSRRLETAEAEYLAGERVAAVEAYTAAIAAAEQAGRADLAADWRYTQGSIRLELDDYEGAIASFLPLADALSPQPRSAAAHLLLAFARGRLYDAQRTQSRRIAYETVLTTHLSRFADDVTADDARLMLALLEEQRLQASKALPHYLAVRVGHARYDVATAGAARCLETIVLRLRQRGLSADEFLATGLRELPARLEALPRETSWSPAWAEVAVRLARLQLLSTPPRYADAAAMLERVDREFARVVDPAALDGWRPWTDAALPVALIAMAGTGQMPAARERLAAPALEEPARLVAVVEGLDQLAQRPAAGQFVDVTELLVEALARLEPHRATLSAIERERCDLIRLRTFLVTGRIAEGLPLVKELRASAGQDRAKLLALARLLGDIDNVPTQVEALALWRAIEGLEQAGTDDWLIARAGVIHGLWLTGDHAEARRLLKLTRLLYPELKPPALKARFETLEEQLRPR